MRLLMQNTDPLTTLFNHYCVCGDAWVRDLPASFHAVRGGYGLVLTLTWLLWVLTLKQNKEDAVPFPSFLRFVADVRIVPSLCPVSQADAVFRMVAQVDRYT